jgi:hypothetical protein
MRLGLLVFALAACSSPASAGPAWPKSTARDVDGGESLAPRAAARTVATANAEDDDDDDKPAAPAAGEPRAADKPAAARDGGTPVGPAASPATDEPITTEEIVIEIED